MLDPVTLSVVRNGLQQVRTRIPVVRNRIGSSPARDVSAAVRTESGKA